MSIFLIKDLLKYQNVGIIQIETAVGLNPTCKCVQCHIANSVLVNIFKNLLTIELEFLTEFLVVDNSWWMSFKYFKKTF